MITTQEKANELGEPDEIYLQLHNSEDYDVNSPSDYRSEGVTWCWHRIHNNDVRYIREDLVPQRIVLSQEDYNTFIEAVNNPPEPSAKILEAAKMAKQRKDGRDRCEYCYGSRGGVLGNEGIIGGKLICDYCHSDWLKGIL